MAKLSELKMVVFLKAGDITAGSKKGLYNVSVKMRHNHDDHDKIIPTKVFIQGLPIGLVDVAGDAEFTFTDVPLDRSKPVRVKIERAGYHEGDEIEIPAVVTTPPRVKVAGTNAPLIEVLNPPRDPDPTTGLFFVTVVTRNRTTGKRANRPFDQTSTPEPVEIYQPDATGVLVPVMKFRSATAGLYHLWIKFDGRQAQITFQLDGQRAVLHLRK